MLTAARLREDAGPAGLDWITALRAPQVKALVRDGALQLSLFDRMDLAEIASPDYPGERLVACKNPFLEAERARKRESLLQATEADLGRSPRLSRGNAGRCAARTRSCCAPTGCCAAARSPSTSPPASADDSFTYARDQDSITAEAALDGIYVLRTSVAASGLDSGEVVASYKALAQVERAFRAFNTDLDIRPIRHRTEGGSAPTCSCGCCRTTSPGTCTTASRRSCSPTTTSHRPGRPAQPRRPRCPLPAGPGQSRCQAHPGRPAGAQLPDLLADLATICLNQIQPADPALPAFRLVTTPTPLQRHALDLLGVSHRHGSRSQRPAPHHPETPGKRHPPHITGGNFGLAAALKTSCGRGAAGDRARQARSPCAATRRPGTDRR